MYLISVGAGEEVGAGGNESHSGHLHHVTVGTFFVNAYLMPLDDI